MQRLPVLLALTLLLGAPGAALAACKQAAKRVQASPPPHVARR